MSEVASRGELTIGIDAINLRRGGGITHLREMLSAAIPEKLGLARIFVWGAQAELEYLPDQSWLIKVSVPAAGRGLLSRTIWQCLMLSRAARKVGCDVLFVPGGSYAGDFTPVVTMSRNMLPFEWRELRRYGCSFFTLKLGMLRWVQSRTYRRADGLIFLTRYAEEKVTKVVGNIDATTAIIPHGLSERFRLPPKVQRDIHAYNYNQPYRILYVSIVDHYKHQWNLVKAVSSLRREGFPLFLELVGPANKAALMRLENTLLQEGASEEWVRYSGAVAFDQLHKSYANADLGVFASSCENMPNILLETMASGLPIACSNRGPMPEILQGAGVYFDPEEPADIIRALREIICSAKTREDLSHASYDSSQQYSWSQCADMTLQFLIQIARKKVTYVQK
jgi:glycosyltransferase involved in cell wall biosynthesis